MDSSYGVSAGRVAGADVAGRSIAAIDPLARRATTVYDPAGRAIVEINANGGRQTTTYDAAGRRIGLRDPRGYRMSFTYDAAGQTTSEVNAVGSRTTFTYDANSQRVGRLDPRGIPTTWTYDAANRMRSRRQPGGQIVTWTHDPAGNLVQLETPLGRYTRTFDPADNVLLMTTPEDQTLQWVRDPLGRRKVLIDPDGGRTTYTCNGLGQVTKLVNSHLERTTTVYDPAGRETRLELDNGTVTTTIYDAAGQTVRVAHVGFENFDYGYDAAGRRTRLVESPGDRVTWSYDPTGQLVGESRSGANAYATTYVYDPSGNRLVEITATNRTTSVYDGFNRLLKSDSLSGITTYSYDPAGNRTRLEDPSNDLTTYTWNAENHLVQTELPSGDIVTTVWDPINKNAEERIVRRDDGTTTTHYLWDNNNILRETDDVGATEAEYTYIPQPYGDLVSQRREAESHFYQFDALGSTTGLTDESGAVTDEYRYKAFGETVSETGSTENPNQWVAREGYRKDEATGLLNLRARDYDAATGRFASADPLGLDAGDENFFRYVGNDPVDTIDPSGLDDDVPLSERPSNFTRRTCQPTGLKDASTASSIKDTNCYCDDNNDCWYNVPWVAHVKIGRRVTSGDFACVERNGKYLSLGYVQRICGLGRDRGLIFGDNDWSLAFSLDGKASCQELVPPTPEINWELVFQGMRQQQAQNQSFCPAPGQGASYCPPTDFVEGDCGEGVEKFWKLVKGPPQRYRIYYFAAGTEHVANRIAAETELARRCGNQKLGLVQDVKRTVVAGVEVATDEVSAPVALFRDMCEVARNPTLGGAGTAVLGVFLISPRGVWNKADEMGDFSGGGGGGSAPNIPPALKSNSVNISSEQLEKKWKHAPDFGITTPNRNPRTLADFGRAIAAHLDDAATVEKGTYLYVKDSKVFFNPNTNLVVIVDGCGNFVSGFKLAPGTPQFQKYITEGVLR